MFLINRIKAPLTMSQSQDVNGKESSKRYWAKRFFTLGYWIAIATFLIWVVSHFFTDKELIIPSALIEMWTWMMGFASAIIIGTVFEKPKQ